MLGGLPKDIFADGLRVFSQSASWNALFTSLFVIILSGILTSQQKEIIVFWRLKDRLPACRAFSLLAKQDNRVNLETLKRIVIPWPRTPNDQNQAWYKLYSTIKDRPIVLHSHKFYLLGREITVLAFLFAVAALVTTLAFIGINRASGFYFGMLVAQYPVAALATRNCPIGLFAMSLR